MKHLTPLQATEIDLNVTQIYRHIEGLRSMMDRLNAEQSDEMNEIISQKYPFNFSLDEMVYEVKVWKEDIKRAIGK